MVCFQFITAYPNPESKTTCIRLMISYIIDHQVAQLALAANLATGWHQTGILISNKACSCLNHKNLIPHFKRGAFSQHSFGMYSSWRGSIRRRPHSGPTQTQAPNFSGATKNCKSNSHFKCWLIAFVYNNVMLFLKYQRVKFLPQDSRRVKRWDRLCFFLSCNKNT